MPANLHPVLKKQKMNVMLQLNISGEDHLSQVDQDGDINYTVFKYIQQSKVGNSSTLW